MAAILRIWAVFVVAIKRILSQKGLALAVLLGLAASVALTMSIPLYADAVYRNTFQEDVAQAQGGTARQPYSFLFRYIGAWYDPVTWDDVQPVDEYLTQQAGAALGLEQQYLVRYFETEPFRMYPGDQTVFDDLHQPLTWAAFSFVSDLGAHINLLEGEFPVAAESSADGLVEVLVSEALATELGLQVGEIYITYLTEETQTGEEASVQIPVRIAGVWAAVDPQDSYWFIEPKFMDQELIVPEETFVGRIAPYVRAEVYGASWYLVMDGSSVHFSEAGPLLARIHAVEQRAGILLPNTRLDISPMDGLVEYRRATRLLTILLYAFSIPILGLILAFIGLVASLSVERQRNEIAVIRSRGATVSQVIGIVLLEGLLLGAVALVVGAPVGMRIAQVMGQTRSFLDFVGGTAVQVSLSTTAFRAGLIAVGLTVIAQIIPSISAARHTIVTYKQERARLMRPPWWQRAWLDVMLFIPAAYGAYLLREQGSIAILEQGSNRDPFQNPLLFLVPALGIFALTLFLLRLIPLFMRVVAWLAAYTKSVGLLMAARHLARTPGSYATPLILLVLTLSLSAFTASLAQTLDMHLFDQFYYRGGADLTFLETGSSSATSQFGQPSSNEIPVQDELDPVPEFYIPVTEYLELPEVQAAARLGRYAAYPQFGGDRGSEGTFIGIDRIDFPQVAFWRRDFAPQNLGALMNELALVSDGLLVDRDFLQAHGLQVGDTLRLKIFISGQGYDLNYTVVGAFDLFPTWYPHEGSLFVGNLEHFFEMAGNVFPYRVWLQVYPDVDPGQISEIRLSDLNRVVLGLNSPQPQIIDAERRPERQGLFGLLSVGFAAAALLTVAGFLLYSLFSFRRRFIELGVLRAVGLSSSQMMAYLGWELIFFILIGGGAGTFLGILASQLFIPSLQVGYGAAALIPPFVVQIAWPAILQIYALFGFLFLITLVLLIVLLGRMKIFQAIKLGETV